MKVPDGPVTAICVPGELGAAGEISVLLILYPPYQWNMSLQGFVLHIIEYDRLCQYVPVLVLGFRKAVTGSVRLDCGAPGRCWAKNSFQWHKFKYHETDCQKPLECVIIEINQN